jgi:transposase-like protein
MGEHFEQPFCFYLSQYCLSFRNLLAMMEERGLSMAHTTIMRWVYQ